MPYRQEDLLSLQSRLADHAWNQYFVPGRRFGLVIRLGSIGAGTKTLSDIGARLDYILYLLRLWHIKSIWTLYFGPSYVLHDPTALALLAVSVALLTVLVYKICSKRFL